MVRNVSAEGAGTSHAERTARVRSALAESGIDSFDALVDRLADSAPLLHEDHIMMVGNRDGSAPPAPRPHQPPEMMVVIDGETNEPDTVREFDGQPLYSTPGFDKKGNEVLYSFTTPQGLSDHLVAKQMLATQRHDIGTTNPEASP